MSATGSEEGILSSLLRNVAKNKSEQSNAKDLPAKRLEDCIVGPDAKERMKGHPYWGYNSSPKQVQRKRKRGEPVSVSDSIGGDGDGDGDGDKSENQTETDTFHKAMETFLSTGCCVIPDVLPKEFVENSKEKVTSDLKYLQTELQNRKRDAIEQHNEHLLAQVARGDFRELVDRDGGRRDVRFQLDRFPFASSSLIYNPIVYPLVRELLGGGDVNLLYAGVMWAMPLDNNKTKEEEEEEEEEEKVSNGMMKDDQGLLQRMDKASQKWHGDGGHLFDHTHLPPHCINVFYPLVNLTKFNGPTEVMSGTHRLGKLNDPSAPKFGLQCNQGDVLLFDYRLKHRGGANFTNEPRPILYLAYAKPFFRDAGNSRSGISLIRSTNGKTSPPWVARILSGDPMPMGHFETCEHSLDVTTDDSDTKKPPPHCNDRDVGEIGQGSGERWILFKMNVELPGCDTPKVLTVHHGDIALEVSARFCRENGLGEEFVPVLGGSIQNQIEAAQM